MPQIHRRTTPRVRGGRVQKKNRTQRTARLPESTDGPIIDRQKPGRGYRHLLLKRDIERFIALLPDWKMLSVGLNAVVLAPGDWSAQGWHRPGIVAVCAWERELWYSTFQWYHDEHKRVFDQIGLEREPESDGYVLLKWTESAIRAYQLTHILLHELGHHHDRMTTRSKWRAARGEGYAERYALDYSDRIWDRYVNEFGLP